MRYESWISYRYLMSSKGRFLTFLNIISIAGIAIGVASLIVVISVMTGFGNNLRDKIIGTTPHVMIEKETGLRNYDELISQIKSLDSVVGVAPYIQGNIFLEQDGNAMGLAVRGIDPEREGEVTKVSTYLIEGKMPELTGDSIIIGQELARYFSYKIGDKVTLISPGSGIKGEGWRYELSIVGIFKTGMVDFDTNLVLVNIKKAQQIFGMGENTATGLGVKLQNPEDATEIKPAIYGIIGYSYLVKTWIDMNRNLFEALFLEKWGLFLILVMMVLVASFNIISTLVVTVSTKTHDIGILKSIGVPKDSIRRIFTRQGIYIGICGILWGLGAGFGLCYILKHYIRVPQEIYSIDHVPVDIQGFDVLAIVAAAFVISYLATIYPSAKAANLQPVEALRYQ